MRTTTISSLLLFFALTSPAVAQKKYEKVNAQLQREIMPKLVKLIDTLGRGRVDNAVDQVEALFRQKFKKASGPFGVDERETWRTKLAWFADTKAQFESVDLLAIQHASPQVHTITLLGNGKYGPIMFRLTLFRYRGKLILKHCWFNSVWKTIDPIVYGLKDRIDKHYPLVTQAAAADEPQSRN